MPFTTSASLLSALEAPARPGPVGRRDRPGDSDSDSDSTSQVMTLDSGLGARVAVAGSLSRGRPVCSGFTQVPRSQLQAGSAGAPEFEFKGAAPL